MKLLILMAYMSEDLRYLTWPMSLRLDRKDVNHVTRGSDQSSLLSLVIFCVLRHGMTYAVQSFALTAYRLGIWLVGRPLNTVAASTVMRRVRVV